MDDNAENSEKVLILPLNEDSKKITQTLSNDTSLKILELLAQKSLSATEIADELEIALTTVKYNLDALIECDLIKVKQTRWSQKGREIKIYEPVQKLIVVVPGRRNPDRSSIAGILRKYLGIVAAAVFASAGVEYLSRIGNFGGFAAQERDSLLIPESRAFMEEAQMMPPNETAYDGVQAIAPLLNGTDDSIAGAAMEAAPMPTTTTEVLSKSAESIATPAANALNYDLTSHIGIWFFFGCMFVIIFLMIREVYYRKKSL
ncbi:MAG: winged helix-turn-helix transcriptional regulator [Methanosarcinaceae archaeon]|nr:winged helix-turn-helix transcriptional regulator [Methanosarcinaceae archaeon]